MQNIVMQWLIVQAKCFCTASILFIQKRLYILAYRTDIFLPFNRSAAFTSKYIINILKIVDIIRHTINIRSYYLHHISNRYVYYSTHHIRWRYIFTFVQINQFRIPFFYFFTQTKISISVSANVSLIIFETLLHIRRSRPQPMSGIAILFIFFSIQISLIITNAPVRELYVGLL